MSTYITADIHGELDRFEAMLDGIGLGRDDRLYILGDAVDRGPAPLDTLYRIMGMKNVRLLLGNHEEMLMNYLLTALDADIWRLCGGGTTLAELEGLSDAGQNKIFNYLAACPEYLGMMAGEDKYYLVHALPSNLRKNRLWGRPDPEDDFGRFGVGTVLFGHTPTAYLDPDQPGHWRIWHGRGAIGLDCGCGHLEDDRRRLAVLRLDDLREYYF